MNEMEDFKKTVQDITLEHLERLHDAAVKSSKHYPGRGVHKDVVKDLVARSILTDAKLPGDWVEQFNKMLSVLQNTVEKHAGKNGKVRAREWRQWIDVMKTGYVEGAKG